LIVENFKQKLNKVSCFVFDLDGVLTDGTLLVTKEENYRRMNMRDGYALKAAAEAGYKIFVISGGHTVSVSDRLKNLKVTAYHQAVDDKVKVLKEVMENHNLQAENILYMGDDIPDYRAMKMCGVQTCPADAVPEIKSISIYVSDKTGGNGCARDVIEQVMRLHGKWFKG
jgi:3-deoxy-D-manno-octulosonate 8-phosphate phosphatase (KDO 8-P phosphatase)